MKIIMTNLVAKKLSDYQDIYDFFRKGFYERSVKNKESILFEMKDVWSKHNLGIVLNRFDTIKTGEGFWERLSDQFGSIDQDDKMGVYCLLADLMALHYVFTSGAGLNAMKEAIGKKLPDIFKISMETELDFSVTKSWGRVGGGQRYNEARPAGMCYFALVASAYEFDNSVKEALEILYTEQSWPLSDHACFTEKLDRLSPQSLIENKYPKSKTNSGVRSMLDVNSLFHQFALLHSAAPSIFLPIVSLGDIEKIIETFGSLIVKPANIKKIPVAERLKLTREISVELEGKFRLAGDENYYFYHPEIKPLWHDGTRAKEEALGLTGALKIKKQIIFYGPPGTGKTYTAKELARNYLLQQRIKDSDISTVLHSMDGTRNSGAVVDSQIIEIQIHPNMGYEDFIGGYTLKETNTKYEKGVFWKAMDYAKNISNNDPVFVILDEINRTDLSRMMGECLSRLEYRDEPITVPNTRKKDGPFVIPSNVFVIGTMNEIDHSLERIDFAMRRRFIWIESGFDSDSLREILMQENLKESDQKAKFLEPNLIIDDLVERAKKLNKSIEEQPTLGKKYHIGHTYFLDINNKNLCELNNENEITFSKYKKGLKLLWEFSLKPILESYEPGENADYMKKFESIFLPNSK